MGRKPKQYPTEWISVTVGIMRLHVDILDAEAKENFRTRSSQLRMIITEWIAAREANAEPLEGKEEKA
jgi:hypothetical protein